MENDTAAPVITNYSTGSLVYYEEALSNARTVVLVIELSLLCIIVMGNSFVLALFWQERKYHNTSHKYIVSMAVSDLLQGVVNAPVIIYLNTGIKIGSDECLAALIIGSSAAIVSLIIIFATSVDRYWAIVHPVSYKTKSTATVANCKYDISTVISSLS